MNDTGQEMRNNPLLKAVIQTIIEQTGDGKGYIAESGLAEVMNISRTRLRETLQTLNAYGIIEKRQKLGVAIKPITQASVKETYELRQLLEGHAIKTALVHVTDEDIQELENFVKTIQIAEQMNDRRMTAVYDLKFHRKIIDIANLPLLKRILDNLHLIENSFVNTVNVEAFTDKPNPYSHQLIIQALTAQDKKCVKLLQNHIAWVSRKELKKFDQLPERRPIDFQPLTTGGELLTAVSY